MNVVRIPVSEQVGERFRQLSRQKQKLLKDKVAALLEEEVRQSVGTANDMGTFQEAMCMTDEDMVLTFGQEYLARQDWRPAHE